MISRRTHLPILAALVIGLGCAPDRATANPAEPPAPVPRFAEESLSAVALMRNANRTTGGCTAVLIEVDLALTAAHCAQGAVSGPSAMQLVFRAHDPSRAMRITVRSVAFHEDAFDGQWRSPEGAITDVALLKLAREVPQDVATPLPVVPSTDTSAQSPRSEAWAIYGYPHGDSTFLRGHPACRIVGVGSGLLGSDCSVVGGMSGSPAMSGEPGSWRVKGITVARVDGNGVRSIIVDLLPFPSFRQFGMPLPPRPVATPSIPTPPATPPSAVPETSP